MSDRSFFGHSLSTFFLFISLAFLSPPSQAMEKEEISVEKGIKHTSALRENPVTYIHDKEQKTVRFFLNEKRSRKELDSLENFFATMFPQAVVTFEGEISEEKFIKTLPSALERFGLFGRFHIENGSIFVVHDPKKDFIQLELGENEAELTTSNLSSFLPEKIDQKIIKGQIDSLEGLPLVSLRLTKYTGGFRIGYYFNHIFDQSSIVEFFKYWSSIYTLGEGNTSLKPPVYLDLSDFKELAPTPLPKLEEVRAEGEKEGFKYITDRKAVGDLLKKREANPTLELQFDEAVLEKFKEKDNSISKNNVIQAVLFQIYAMNPEFSHKELSFAFACDMRKRIPLAQEVIGNALVSGHIPLKIDDVKNKDILELAKLSQSYVAKIGKPEFKKRLAFYDHLQRHKENPQAYPANSISDELAPRVSNWSSFDYSSINFEGAKLVALHTKPYDKFGISIICFDNTKGKKTLTTSVKLPEVCLPAVKELQEKTGLFTYRVQK